MYQNLFFFRSKLVKIVKTCQKMSIFPQNFRVFKCFQGPKCTKMCFFKVKTYQNSGSDEDSLKDVI